LKKIRLFLFSALALSMAGLSGAAGAADPAMPAQTPWLDPGLSPDARADAAVKAMTQKEKLQLVFGYFSADATWMVNQTKNFVTPKEGLPQSAGYVPGIARLGIPAQWETDAGIGVATQYTQKPRLRTALPSGIATTATWNPDMALAGGAMIGNEARLSGFNVQLAGGMNLVRDPRNGRNFEYGGEDPLLAGVMTGYQVKGIQSNHIISTMKHFAFNGQETNRNHLDVKIGERAARESDLLAFQMAYEIGNPGAVMCAYNRINGVYSCENDWLLNQVLKTDWGFKGYVMSDWGAVHSTVAASVSGLDQQSGWAFDKSPYFADALAEAVNNGHVSQDRLDDMARRVLYAMFAQGVVDHPVNGDQADKIDGAAHARITQADAEEAIVLLKNNGVLPLAKSAKTIVVVGGNADFGVISGGGSSQVSALGSKRFDGPHGQMVFYPSSPVEALKAHTGARIVFVDGADKAAAAKAARTADLVIVFATQWASEGLDAAGLNLPGDQNDLIASVARANKKTVVVLETGGPVAMPWLGSVGGVMEAWFPGTSGGEAIARILTGEANPSGHLPVTFPASLDQLPRPKLDGDPELDKLDESRPHTDYDIEGAAVGYKWFDKTGQTPLFPFGYGLSYTRFASTGLHAETAGKGVKVSVTVRNIGKVPGSEVTQIYVAPADKDAAAAGWEAPKRLGAFAKTRLDAGESKLVSLSIDPRLLARFDPATKTWIVTAGDYKVMTGSSSQTLTSATTIHVPQMVLDVRGQ
jgi:beta-glucosidase